MSEEESLHFEEMAHDLGVAGIMSHYLLDALVIVKVQQTFEGFLMQFQSYWYPRGRILVSYARKYELVFLDKSTAEHLMAKMEIHVPMWAEQMGLPVVQAHNVPDLIIKFKVITKTNNLFF
jgi:hypothetical protein